MALADILSKQSSAVERPKPLPVGSYICIVTGLPRQDKSTKKGTDYFEWVLKFQSAGDDVDEEALTAALGDKNLSERTIKVTYYLTEDALWRLIQFLDHCDAGDEDMTVAQRVNETPNCQVGIYLKHVPSDDGETMYANIGKTFKVD